MTPIAYFNEVWRRCAEIEALYAYMSGQLTAALSPDELLRAEWVARVSALDLYVHELVAQNMLSIFEGVRPSCSGYGRFQFSGETLTRIHNAQSQNEAIAAFELEVRSRLGRITYQSPDDIADGVRLVSDCELWNQVAVVLGAAPANRTSQAKTIKRTLALIVERRNKIAHEGDLQPTAPRMPWPINRNDVDDVTAFIADIVTAIDQVV